MDTELAKLVMPFLAGAMALAGGLFSFVNGRLNEAKTHDARQRVITWTLGSLSFAFILVGLIVSFFKVSLASSIFFLISFALQVILFVRGIGPINRIELALFCLTCSVMTTAIGFVLVLDLVSRNVEITGRIIDLLKPLDGLSP
jgi:hypothetical protein